MTIIVLEREGERQELVIQNSVSFAGKLTKLAYQGWQVVDCRGEGKVADHIRKGIADYKKDPKGYKVPIAATVKAGCAEAEADFEKVKKQFKKRFGVNVE